MAYLWSNPYGFTMGEWFALTTWQKFKIFLWRHRYKRGYYCNFLRARVRSEFLHKSLKGEDFQCSCETIDGGSQCTCGGKSRCWLKGNRRVCWCKCTPDGTLSQGVGNNTKYIHEEAK